MAGKPGGESAGKSDINELRAHFSTLNMSQKREFIQKLQQKLAGVKSMKYKVFLSECIEAYNKEAQAREISAKAKEANQPAISSESFAIAFASMLTAERADPSAPAIGRQLVGTWQREYDGRVFYYKVA